MGNTLKEIVRRQKAGEAVGICSVCSSSAFVIDAALAQAARWDTDVLIEATANQVNQFGGYTGMKPADFRDWVLAKADRAGLPRGRVILGGDHLGPVAWKGEPADRAMEKAEELVRAFARAGFTKIHLDCSMPLGDEKTLTTEEIAGRAVHLALAAEEETAGRKGELPVYVIGSEVPTPGGSGEEDDLQVTRPEDLRAMLDCFREKFTEAELDWDRVVAAVVQPGVEFGNDSIREYVPEEARELAEAAREVPGIVLEGHSTDYQTPQSLEAMVRDGIAILKVGPALTFAAREALFALSDIERISLPAKHPEEDIRISGFPEVLDLAMRDNPANWRNHYNADEPAAALLRKYSFSDRSRYYMNEPAVEEAVKRLMGNLRDDPPQLFLLSQFMPAQYERVREGVLDPDPQELVIDRIRQVLDQYWQACGLCGQEKKERP